VEFQLNDSPSSKRSKTGVESILEDVAQGLNQFLRALEENNMEIISKSTIGGIQIPGDQDGVVGVEETAISNEVNALQKLLVLVNQKVNEIHGIRVSFYSFAS
jgi:hypothetical protein